MRASCEAAWPPAARRRIRVLIGDDDAWILHALSLRLSHEGFEVVEARDGEEVLRRAREGHIQLILLDVKMPKLDGFQVCERLKTDAATARIPIVVLAASSSNGQGLTDRYLELGIADWV
jgi:CheY-like chemotaxis protein